MTFELGLDTFGDRSLLPDGGLATHAHVLRDVLEQAALADRVGLDFFGVGEHANGAMPHAQLMRSIELIGREVAPRVREQLSTNTPA